jgi:hypothetical protein
MQVPISLHLTYNTYGCCYLKSKSDKGERPMPDSDIASELYLTQEQLGQFRTIADLLHMSRGKDHLLWGLYQKDDDVEFGMGGDGWELQASLKDILIAAEKYGKYNRKRMIVIYAVEYGTNDLKIDLFQLPADRQVCLSADSLFPDESKNLGIKS